MGYLCFLFWILLGGLIGGLIYSLTTENSHQLRLPFRRNGRFIDIETGCLGHAFVGAFAGFLLVSISISHLNFDVSSAVAPGGGPFSPSKPLDTDGFKIVVSSFGLSLIGGYLGLKLINKIAEGTLEEVENKLEKLKGKVADQKSAAVSLGYAFLARGQMRDGGDLGLASSAIQTSLAHKPTRLGELVNALIFKKKGEFQAALDAIERGLKLPPDSDDAAERGTLHWNKACYLARLDPAKNLRQILSDLDLSMQLRPAYRADLETDDDIVASGLLDRPGFVDHFRLPPKSQ